MSACPCLAACGGDDSGTATDPSGRRPRLRPARRPTERPASQPAATPRSTHDLDADIEVGGGAIFADEQVVVTQPTEGEFKCFTAVCTHQGCLVSSVSDGTINCDCHGSQFSIENGDVEQGPATFPLAEVPITVAGDEISLA